MTLKVKWSLEALEEFENIYEYWLKQNNSDTYSQKIWNLTNRAIEIIQIEPELGIQTNHPKVRMRLIGNNYYLIYKIQDTHLEILKFWDVRQDPIKNKYGR